MSSSANTDMSAVSTISHFGGGQIVLQSPKESVSFAKGRIERAADLAEVCAKALHGTDPAVSNTLDLITAMLFEAKDALGN